MAIDIDMSKSGAEMILAERKRQVEEEGFDEKHDDGHTHGELWRAAICYIQHALFGPYWPWEYRWWKPSVNKIEDLTKAGALLAAEIDRLKRIAAVISEDDPN